MAHLIIGGFTWNVVIFGVDSKSLKHLENPNNNLVVLGEEPTDKYQN